MDHQSTKTSLKLQWILSCLCLIVFLAWLNRFPEGMIFAGADAFQVISPNWIERNATYLWTHWLGEGTFSVGSFYYPFFKSILLLANWLDLSPSQHSILYYLFYWLGSYLACLLGISLLALPKISPYSFAASAFSLLYALNPYTFYFFYEIWGFSAFYFLYPLIPILLLGTVAFFTYAKAETNLKALAILYLALLLSTIAFGNVAFFLSLNVVAIGLASLIFFNTSGLSLKTYFYRLAIYLGIEFLATAWAIIPQLQFWLGQASPIVRNEIHNYREWILWQRLNLIDLFTLNPHALSSSLSSSWTFWFGGIFFIVIIWGLWLSRHSPKLKHALVPVVIIIGVIVLIESKGKGIIPGDAAVWLFSNPILGAFRSYGKFYIFLPFLMIYGAWLTINTFTVSRQRTVFTVLLLFIGISIYPIFTGRLQTHYSAMYESTLTCETAPRCNLNRVPKDYVQAAQIITQDGLGGKILSAPYGVINSPGWANFPSWKHVGADPTMQLFSLPVVQMNSYGAFGFPYGLEWAKAGPQNAQSILGLSSDLGVNYILFHKDVDPKFIQPALDYLILLEDQGLLSTLLDSENLRIFRIGLPFQKPLISVQRTVNPDLPKAHKNSGITSEMTNLTFTEINPTKYLVLLPFVDEMLDLQFRESYSSQWKVELVSPKSPLDALPWWQSFTYPTLEESGHALFGGYANQWQINPAKWCTKAGAACATIEKNGSKYLVTMIEYVPQRLLYLLSWLCFGLTALLILFLIMMRLLKNRQSKNRSSP
jgi:hypothetical protein